MIRKEVYLQVNNYRFFAEFISPSNNISSPETLVFLHEGLGCIAQWKDFPQQLCNVTGCRGFLYDRSGYGKSDLLDKPRPLDYLEREALDVLPAILEKSQISNPILIGHSDGGTISLLFAAKFPGVVKGVITEAAHVFVEKITLQGIRDSLKVFGEDRELKAKLVKYQGQHADQIILDWKNIWLSPEFRNWNIEKHLPKITCPVLVIQGEYDNYDSPDQVEAIANQVSGFSQKLLILECGHRPHHQTPEIVLKEMTLFIKRIINAKAR